MFDLSRIEDASRSHHKMTRRFFDPNYQGHPDDMHDQALFEEASQLDSDFLLLFKSEQTGSVCE